jgi:hypothetical protein
MIFDSKLWEKEAVSVLGSTLASLYATILVCVYMASIFTELFRFHDTEIPKVWHLQICTVMLESVLPFLAIKISR